MTPSRRTRRHLAALLFATVLPPAMVQAQSRAVDVPAGPLAPALSRYAQQMGVALVLDAPQLAGLMSPGLRGTYDVEEGFARLLQNQPYRAVRTDAGYVLRPAPPAGVAELAAVPVYGGLSTGAFSGYAATDSNTAMKTDTPLLETPQSISVVGRDEMDSRGVQDIMDVVRYTAGITTNTYGPDNRGWDDISIRGFSSYYSSYRDGLALTPAGVSYYMSEPYGLERVDVLRGPSSMVFGQGDAGGIINKVSKQPNGSAIREVELQYGSFDRKQVGVDIGDAIGENGLSYRLVGLGLDSHDQDEYPDGHKIDRTRVYVAPSVRWQPNAGTSFTLYAEYLKHKSGEDPYYLNAYGRYTDVKMGDYSFSSFKQTQSSVGYHFETALNDNWKVAQNLRYAQISLDRRVVWVDSVDVDGRTLKRVARTWDDPLHQTGVDTQLQGKFRTGLAEHTFLAGMDWNEQIATANRYIGLAPDLDLYNPVYGMHVDMPADPLAHYRQTVQVLGLYAQDQIKLDSRWMLTLGGRQDYVKSTTHDYLAGDTTRQKDHAFSSRAALSYLFDAGWAPYLSYAESFLPNSGTDAAGSPFLPSRGKQVELGLKYQPAGRKLLATLALFDLRKTNVVTYDPVTFDARQIGKQKSQGVELEVKGEVVPRLNMTASYTYQDIKVKRSADPQEVGKTLVGIPAHSAAVWMDYLWGGGVGSGLGARYIGKRANDEYNTSFVGGVTLLDGSVYVERNAWRVALNVSNLLNRKYFSICYHDECYRGTERNITLTARYRY
ncbi:TonB-dependent siderophore receptor [Bordetella genomosp. 12]|uniref:TonB-dependent siderophore receptor n=1 Tax=Bordetella genomosp. 12 TaxID=463035 RepID=A0A261VKQ3_9BORD|nr:TonB-dependent siderophore receptor [Bordetella genomosp. 12]OZI74082.1 TonB-dependent siderophore receptor [Bordetella genomosp. 12]